MLVVFVWYVLLYVLSSFAIILTRKRERADCFALIVFWMSYYNCYVALPHCAVCCFAVCDYGIS